MSNSQDRENNSISVDSDLFISGVKEELDSILVLENLNPREYCFVTLAVVKVKNYNNTNNAVAKLDVVHTPKVNRCSHSEIDIDIMATAKPGSILSNAKFKKLRRSLAKMVHQIIYDDEVRDIRN